MELLRRQFNYLERFEVVRFQMLAYIRMVSLSFPLKQRYQDIYGQHHGKANKLASKQDQNKPPVLVIDDDDELVDLKLQSLNDANLNPRRILVIFKLFDVFRLFTTFWMIYEIVKFYSIGRDELIERVTGIKLARPLHCYLAGRFLVQERFGDLIALIFAILHLSWRSYQSFQRPYSLSLIEFMLLSEKELEMVHSRLLPPGRSIELTIGDHKRLSARTRLILETMCYQNHGKQRIVYRLRPNRTPDTHLRLRRAIARLTYACLAVFMSITVILTIGFVPYLVLDQTYMRMYPNCDLQLVHLKEEGRLAWWSITLTGHHWYVGLTDGLENAVMYAEGGMVVYTGITLFSLVSMDMSQHWTGIKRKLDSLHKRIETDHCSRISIHIEKSSEFQLEVKDLLASMSDFFRQVKLLDEVISGFLVGTLFCSLLVCALLTYHSRVHSIQQLPFQVMMVVALMATWAVTAAYGCLSLHNYCVSSYPNLCSLMARDSMKHRHNYEAIVDFYTKRRSCFTIMKQVPLLPTTFLTMIGWTFSCFCIISGLLRDSEMNAILRKGCELTCRNNTNPEVLIS